MKWGIVLALLTLSSARLIADGGLVVGRQTVEGETAVLFASPLPLRAGPADLSLMLTDASGKVRTDAPVTLALTEPPEPGADAPPPCCRIEPPPPLQTFDLKSGTGGNQLLYEIRTRLPRSGEWEGRVTWIGADLQPREAVFHFSVSPPPDGFDTTWPYLLIPVGALGAILLHHGATRAGHRSKAALR